MSYFSTSCVVVLSAAFMSSACTELQISEAGLDSALVASIDQTFGHLEAENSPGASVMVIENGVVSFTRSYGYTDITGGEHLSRSTPFRLASVSKQFTATAILILQERGKVSVEDSVVDYIPEISRFGKDITIRHLLTHTSGLPDYYYDVLRDRMENHPSVDDDSLFTNVDGAAAFQDWGELRASPGDRYEYSNPGYELLALIVERVSGQTFGTFLKENIFEPAGMETAVCRDRPTVTIPNRAIGYRKAEDDTHWIEHDDHVMNWMVGAGCVYASLDDLHAWDTALTNDEIITRETLEAARTPTKLNSDSLSWYGFGWGISDDPEVTCVDHHGGWVGFRTYMLRCTEPAKSVIILTNSSFQPEDQAELVEAIVNG